MAEKDEFVAVRMNKPELESLDYLAGLTRMNRSNLIRILNPCRAAIDAFRCYYEHYNLDTKNMADEFTDRAVAFLESQMTCPSDSCIEYQVKVVCTHPDRTKKVAELYCKWSKAVRDVEGFKINPVCTEGGACTHIVIGPGDSLDYVKLVENEVRRLLAKSVEGTTKLLKDFGDK
jgi:hypothetical protein